MKNNRTILISGASIAGPALAYWLNRYDFQPTIIEKTPELREGGYKIDIRGAAIEVAKQMGIMDEVKQSTTNMKGGTIVNRQNKAVASMPVDFFNMREGEDCEIMRGDLAHILYRQTSKEVEYIFDESITSMKQDEDGIHVTFMHSAPRTFDLVVGADGLHSQVRKLVFGNEARFLYHLGAYVSIFTTPNVLNLDHWELYYNMPHKFVSLYSANDKARAMSFFLFNSPPLDYDYHDTEQQKQLLINEYEHEGWQIPQLFKTLKEAPDFYFDSVSQIQMDHWSMGRTVLLGDAGYCPSPASGQGTSLALVGAYVLAGELAQASGDYQTAFTAYEHEMRNFVKMNQNLAIKTIKSLLPQTKTAIWFRTLMLRLMPYMPGKESMMQKMNEDVQQSANAITLKNYQTSNTNTIVTSSKK